MQFLKFTILVILALAVEYARSYDEDSALGSLHRRDGGQSAGDSASGRRKGRDSAQSAEDSASGSLEGQDSSQSAEDSASGSHEGQDSSQSAKDSSSGSEDSSQSGEDSDSGSPETLAGGDSGPPAQDSTLAMLTAPCKPGTNYWNDCNMCHCFESGRSACTLVACGTTKFTLTASDKKQAAFKKLRDQSTNCVPGETITMHSGCVCNCAIPSVTVCPADCLNGAR